MTLHKYPDCYDWDETDDCYSGYDGSKHHTTLDPESGHAGCFVGTNHISCIPLRFDLCNKSERFKYTCFKYTCTCSRNQSTHSSHFCKPIAINKQHDACKLCGEWLTKSGFSSDRVQGSCMLEWKLCTYTPIATVYI